VLALLTRVVREYSLSMETTRDRMVEAGMTLFGERGYDATSVADIQVACGLTAPRPGSWSARR
jgi:AcrR family transcriptional regulator